MERKTLYVGNGRTDVACTESIGNEELLEIDDVKFDNIILDETLNHFHSISLVLEKCKSILVKDGTLSIHTRFGISSLEKKDNKRYFLELYKSIDSYFDITSVVFNSRTLVIECENCSSEKRDKSDRIPLYLRVIEEMIYISEKEWSEAYKKQEKDRRESIDALRIQVDELNQINSSLKKRNKELLGEISKKDRMLEEMDAFKEDAKGTISYYKKELDAFKRSKAGKFIFAWRRLKDAFCLKNKKTTRVSNKTDLKNKQVSSLKESGFASLLELAKTIPDSNGTRFYTKSDCRVGIVCDEFLYDSWKDAVNLVYLTPDNWEKAVYDVDFVIICSAWKGLNSEWPFLSQDESVSRKELYRLIEGTRSINKKVVFYSKEDPPNYDLFLGIAKRCDLILTTCIEVVDKYKSDCNTDNVHVLEFSVNPLRSNPIGMNNPCRKNEVVFAGSWMNNKYPNRQLSLKMLFDGTIEANKELTIIDRNSDRPDRSEYLYPIKYSDYIVPSVPHDLLLKTYKLFDWALDINSVVDSMTMFAVRGYELLGCGTAVISNYSVGVNDKLPMAFTIADKSEIPLILNGYTGDDLYHIQIAGIRSVLDKDTSFDRINQVLELTGRSAGQPIRRVLVIADEITSHIQDMFESQTYPYRDLKKANSLTEDDYSEYDMIAFFSDSMSYQTFYLEDMINGFKYTNCDYITKDSYYLGDVLLQGREHEYVSLMRSKYQTVFWRECFSLDELLHFSGPQTLSNGYSIDHLSFNATVNRVNKNNDYLLSVIIPIYNNGNRLMGKGFGSLVRSSVFEKMEIILVDDGSTDSYTRKVVEYLDKTYPNTRSFFYPLGGSGSASRPRNKGVELATSNYVAFIDPDNEAVSDGYAKLLSVIQGSAYDFVFGDILKLTEGISRSNYYKQLHKIYSDDVVNNPMKYMIKCRLTPKSIQAMVINRDFIIKNNIRNVEGAVAQDSLYSWELFFSASCVKAIDLPIHIYYANTGGSTLNTVKKRLFEKHALIAEPIKTVMENNGVLSQYMNLKYNDRMEQIVFKQLAQVQESDAIESTKIVYGMHNQYRDVYNFKSRIVNRFVELCDKDMYAEAFEAVKEYENDRDK